MASHEIISPGRLFWKLGKSAWTALGGHWRAAIGTSCIAFGIQMAVRMVPLFGKIAGLLLCPLAAGMMLFWLRLLRGEQTELSVIFEPFDRYWTFLWANLLVMIFIFLWTLPAIVPGVIIFLCADLRPGIFFFLWIPLLIVPGVIAACRYAMTIYILLDHPESSAGEAMEESCEIMYGYKLRLFGYSLLFVLMIVVAAVFTLGIGLIWLVPWLGVFMAAFYESVRRREAPAALSEPSETEEMPASE